MPIIDAITVVTFETIDVAVLVTTLCTPPMSFEMRDCTSPVRVRVKNASDSRCRWRKTAVRRSCITRWPTWFERSVCHTPSTPVDDRDRDHPAREERELRRVVRDDRLQHAAQQERGDDAECRREEDEREHDRQAAAVVAEETRDAPEVRAAHRRVGGTLRLLAHSSEPVVHAGTVENAGTLVPCAGSASSAVLRAGGQRRTPHPRARSALRRPRAGSASSTAAARSG